MNCELMLTFDTLALRQAGSRNLTGQKTLPTISERSERSEPQEPAPEVEAVVAAVNEVEIEKKEELASEHLPRNCKVTKWPDFQGYGFNLHAVHKTCMHY
jgi:hypothetical protein